MSDNIESEVTAFEAGFLAGQASVEQRVRELERDCDDWKYAFDLKCVEGGNTFRELLALKSERDELSERVGWCNAELNAKDREIATLKEQGDLGNHGACEPVVWMRPEISEDGYVYDSAFRDHKTVISCAGNNWKGWKPLYTHPTTEPVKAQAGEPDARIKQHLVQIHSALCSKLGDTDPYFPDDMTDEEIREANPVFWSAKEIAALIGDAPWDQFTHPTTERRVIPEDVLKHFDEAVECARLLGSTDAKKGYGVFTEQDSHFLRAMYESIAKHRNAMINAAPKQEETK